MIIGNLSPEPSRMTFRLQAFDGGYFFSLGPCIRGRIFRGPTEGCLFGRESRLCPAPPFLALPQIGPGYSRDCNPTGGPGENVGQPSVSAEAPLQETPNPQHPQWASKQLPKKLALITLSCELDESSSRTIGISWQALARKARLRTHLDVEVLDLELASEV